MNIDSSIYDVINDSNDFVPGELPIEYEKLNFNEPCYCVDKMSTGDISGNIINMSKAFDDLFPFIKPIMNLEKIGSKNFIFKTKKFQKRGRKKRETINNNLNRYIRKIHCKTDDDNVLIKIQVHFLTFLINFTNDLIEPYFQAKKKNIYFRQIKYEIKKNITNDHISQLKNCLLKDILQMEISPKCRRYGENYNQIIYNLILQEITKDKNLCWINDFFNLNYLELFGKYYYTWDEKKYFYFKDKKINFSKNTKTFYNLLEKNKNDKEIQKCLKKISERYLNNGRLPLQKTFSITKKE